MDNRYGIFLAKYSLQDSMDNVISTVERKLGVGHRFDHPMSVIPTKVGIHLSGKHGFPPTRE